MADSKNMLFVTTDEQKKEMKEQADLIGITMSELFRWKMFYPSPSDTAALYEIKTDVREMRNRLDETARLHTETLAQLKHSPDNDDLILQLKEIENDYQHLVNTADEISKSWSGLFDEIKTSDLIALKKIHDGEGDQSSDDNQEPLSEYADDQDVGFAHYDPEWEKTWGSSK